MGIKKDIGHGLKEQFENFSVSPDESIWTRIEVNLEAKKKRRKRFLLLWILAPIAFGVILTSIFISSHFSSNLQKNRDQHMKNVDGQEPIKVSKNLKETYSRQKTSHTKADSIKALNKLSDSKFESINHNNLTTNNDSQGDSTLKIKNQFISKTKSGRFYKDNQKTESKLNKSDTNKSSNGTISNSKSTVIEEQNNFEETSNSEDSYTKQSSKNFKRYLNQDDKSKEDAKETMLVDSQTLIDSVQKSTENKLNELENRVKHKDSIEISEIKWSIFVNSSLAYYDGLGKAFSNQISLNYGIYFTYLPSNTLSFRVGANKLNLKQTSLNSSNENIEQEVSYLELPLELKFVVIDRKIKTSAIGGVSYLILEDAMISKMVNNSIFTTANKSDFTDSTISFNMGMEFQTKLFDQFYFNVEPFVKYYFNPYKLKTDFNPFTIMIIGGIEYKF